MKCKHSPDEDKECACKVRRGTRLICDVYDEPVKDIKKCPFRRK